MNANFIAVFEDLELATTTCGLWSLIRMGQVSTSGAYGMPLDREAWRNSASTSFWGSLARRKTPCWRFFLRKKWPMPRGSKGERRPADVNANGVLIGKIATVDVAVMTLKRVSQKHKLCVLLSSRPG